MRRPRPKRRGPAAWPVLLALVGVQLACDPEQDPEEIARALADRLTESLDFEDGKVEEGDPPLGHPGVLDYPQVTSFDAPPTLVEGQDFTVELFTDFVETTRVVGAVVYVLPGSEYISVDSPYNETDGLVRLRGRLRESQEVAGHPFTVRLALLLDLGYVGNYVDWELNVPAGDADTDTDTDIDTDTDTDTSPPQPNGLPCTGNEQCQSGHCQNGYCCDGGDCCSEAVDCPAAYTVAPSCDEPATCQGTRQDAACNAQFVCESQEVQDDSACDAATACKPAACVDTGGGVYEADIADTCSGAADQTGCPDAGAPAPCGDYACSGDVCAVTCAGAADCASLFACASGGVCREDADGDGVAEDGDSSGVAGDNPCVGGAVADCDDNCPTIGNATQADSRGFGVGDDCVSCNPNAQGFEECERFDQRGSRFIVIPAATFWMGCREDLNLAGLDCYTEEEPQHQVDLSEYIIDKDEVTQAKYDEFVQATGHAVPTANWDPAGRPDHPVRNINWSDLQAYCRWTGKDLPTEAQWEHAAVGPMADLDGYRDFPWGASQPTCLLANHTTAAGGPCEGDTTDVGTHPTGVSPFGLHDLAGNVAEWVADWFETGYYGSSPPNDPTGAAAGTNRVIRGGSWNDVSRDLRAVYRRIDTTPGTMLNTVGGRCARSE